jgi:leucyl aminopeptidase
LTLSTAEQDRIEVQTMSEGIGNGREQGGRPLWLVSEAGFEAWLAQLSGASVNWVRGSDFKGQAQRLLCLPGADGSVSGAALGIGSAAGAAEHCIWSLAGLPSKLPGGHWRLATPLAGNAATQALLGWEIGRYRFDRYRKPGAGSALVASFEPPAGADTRYVRLAADAEALVRDLINTPAGDMGPEELAAAAGRVAADHGASCEQVVGEDLMAAGLGMIHAVGRAGPQAPRLIDLRWGSPEHPRVTLVGKGVCFDTGGLDVKSPQGMLLMKKDMGGAACALGLAQMIMSAELPLRLRVLIPAVENSIDAKAYRPGDVLKSRKGLSVEVGNTDAEGRLVLADALALADEEAPELLLDLATLTGAARVALGPDLPALFSNDDALAESIQAAGLDESDPVWRMPLFADYDEDLASKVADLANVSSTGFAGAIIGGLFLQRFVSSATRWVHLDLYGWNPRERPGRPVGGRAQGIRALFRALERRYGARPKG